jgi:phosphoribosylamine--glycine ligase
MTEKILLIGNGAREHAIASAIARSADAKLYAVMGANNPGIAKLCENFTVGNIMDTDVITKYSSEQGIDLAVVGPEAPLGTGICDLLEEQGVRCASPSKKAAQLELNKYFARNLMKEYGVPGRTEFETFDDAGKAADFIDSFGKPVAVKPLGLTGGKGVKIVAPELDGQLKNLEEAKKYARKVIEESVGGFNKVIVEEKLEGEELTLQAFVDSEGNITPMPLVQDHKFAFVGDDGPFTGGMGSYSDADHLLPFMNADDSARAIESMSQTVKALKKEEKTSFVGVLYGQFILTKDGPKLIEYNARFGDPEAMNVLPILKSDFVEVCNAMVSGNLPSLEVEFENKATVCKYAVPKGYPTNPVKGERIEVADSGEAVMFYASVDEREGEIYMSSSRALAYVGIADTIASAERIAEKAVSQVRGSIHYRPDIGTSELIQRRIDHMMKLRGYTR